MDDFFRCMTTALDKRRGNMYASNAFFQAAVLVPLLEVRGEYHVLFEVRSSQLAWQPGEICFPGGKVEAGDGDPETAALREMREELGVAPGAVQVLGTLGEVISPIGVLLFPTVGLLPSDVMLHPSADEVAEIFTVPLKFLLSAKPTAATMELGTKPVSGFPFELLPEYSRQWRRRRTYTVLFYRYEQHVIWGLTAQVLSLFIEICREMKKPSL